MSFPPPAMLIVDLPTERSSSPFNDCRALSTQHYSLFGTQPLIDLCCVKTSELFPCLNFSPPLSALLYQHCFSMSLSRSLFLWLQHSASHFLVYTPPPLPPPTSFFHLCQFKIITTLMPDQHNYPAGQIGWWKLHVWVSVYSFCFLQFDFSDCMLHRLATHTHTHTHWFIRVLSLCL